jgi:flagellar basal body-associated protein FliL
MMKESTKKAIVKWFWILIIVPIVLVAVLLGLVWAFSAIPTIEELENPDSKLATQVIAEEGEIISREKARQIDDAGVVMMDVVIDGKKVRINKKTGDVIA